MNSTVPTNLGTVLVYIYGCNEKAIIYISIKAKITQRKY